MKEIFAKAIPIVLRELMWLFGALIVAAFLAVIVRLVLQLNEDTYQQVLLELPADAVFHLKIVLFSLCLVGIYISRLAVAAVDSLLSA
ncbi:hypothetical protein [Hymenobacter elongatus]|uniref:Uncharacterized protein n=1 Tax=Hymenobacter elongatus TaxID=877208 RepID=A0A4Z0PFR9_9BACT|nr:hypothetical protein [Hymenobacter elongatus]TGE14000.1 hypothetical protein E5J99_17930 [Hymenobacter elongatus]